MQDNPNYLGNFNRLCSCSKITAFIILSLFRLMVHAQTTSAEFASAQEAIDWAYSNKTTAADIKHIIITGNNNKPDLLKLRTLNNNFGSGLFKALESLELSAQTDTLPNNCFYTNYSGVQWLKSFKATHLTGVGNWAFRFCTNLTTIELPALNYIGAFAFYNCALTNIYLPATLSTIEVNPFLGCRNLKGITIDPLNNHFVTEDGVLYNINKSSLISYPLGKTESSFVSPNSVDYIGDNAFGICSSLSKTDFPAVTNVGNWVSEYSTGLNTVTFRTSNAINFGSDVFLGVETENINLVLNEAGDEFNNNVHENIWKNYAWKLVQSDTQASLDDIDDLSDWVKVYPTAVKDFLFIESNLDINEIRVYDLCTKTIIQKNTSVNQVDMSHLKVGMYIVKICTDSRQKELKVLKVK